MPCIESRPRRAAPLSGGSTSAAKAKAACLALAVCIAGCAPLRPPAPAPAPPPAVPAPPAAAPAAPAAPAAEPRARDWRDYHRLAAQRLVKANPGATYMGRVPEPLRGIPVLAVELHADGSVKQITVQRRPRPADAQHTTQLAIDAVRRAAPFPPVSHLPRPWTYTEVFLFDDHDRFKPRTLDD